MQAHYQPRLRKTPFGDTPAPSESRYVQAALIAAATRDEPEQPPYEIFRLQPAIDGLGDANARDRQARN